MARVVLVGFDPDTVDYSIGRMGVVRHVLLSADCGDAHVSSRPLLDPVEHPSS